MEPSVVEICLHIEEALHANVWLFPDFCFILKRFQADECKCNGWKTPIPPAKSPRVEVSQPLASFTDPCRSCTHVLGMEWRFIYPSWDCMLWFVVTCFVNMHIQCFFCFQNDDTFFRALCVSIIDLVALVHWSVIKFLTKEIKLLGAFISLCPVYISSLPTSNSGACSCVGKGGSQRWTQMCWSGGLWTGVCYDNGRLSHPIPCFGPYVCVCVYSHNIQK